jgi:putative transcriptional regulator
MSEQDAATQDFLAGQLLIAMPNMGDPRFERSVVLICTHDADHAMGVIVNKRLDDVSFTELLEQLEIAAGDGADETHVFFGGPVQTERGLVLHSLDYQLDRTVMLPAGLGLTATRDILIDIGGASPKRPAPKHYLLAIGHAGWGAGQLEREIAMNAWIHCEADDSIIFNGAENDAWSQALAKLGVTSAMLSREWASARDTGKPLN